MYHDSSMVLTRDEVSIIKEYREIQIDIHEQNKNIKTEIGLINSFLHKEKNFSKSSQGDQSKINPTTIENGFKNSRKKLSNLLESLEALLNRSSGAINYVTSRTYDLDISYGGLQLHKLELQSIDHSIACEKNKVSNLITQSKNQINR